MNRRALILGIAIFVAIVGMSLLGGEKRAMAGHGCHGCGGCSACYGCDGCVGCAGCCGVVKGCHGCHGYARCRGRRHVRRCRGCRGCAGYVSCCGCNGEVYEGGDHIQKGGDAPAPSTDAAQKVDSTQKVVSASFERAPLVFRQVSFRR